MALTKNNQNSPYPCLYIQGQPGIGKSELLKSICKENNWNLKIVYMSILPLEQITGLPFKDNEKNNVTWSKPIIVDFETGMEVEFDKDDNRPTILFFDDAHTIDKLKQNYLFQLLTYRSLNNWKLPKNVVMVFAGNRLDDRANFVTINSAAVNRFQFYTMEVVLKEWMEWAVENNVHPTVLGFLEYINDPTFFIGQPRENEPYPTPRSWTYLSDMLKSIDKNIDMKMRDEYVISAAYGQVGAEAAEEFVKFYKLYSKYNPEEIFKNNPEGVVNFIENLQNRIEQYACMIRLAQHMVSLITNNDKDVYGKILEKYMSTVKILQKPDKSARVIIPISLKILFKSNIKDSKKFSDLVVHLKDFKEVFELIK
jgi:hypothetical protein